jgi:hypothetical protein
VDQFAGEQPFVDGDEASGETVQDCSQKGQKVGPQGVELVGRCCCSRGGPKKGRRGPAGGRAGRRRDGPNGIHNIHQLNGTSPADAAAREAAIKALCEADTTAAATSRDVTAPDATTTDSEKAPPNSEFAPFDADATITLT